MTFQVGGDLEEAVGSHFADAGTEAQGERDAMWPWACQSEKG